MTKIETFGELMIRLRSYNYECFIQMATVSEAETLAGGGSGRIQR